MDEVTQQNAGLVQQATTASSALDVEAHRLEAAVEVFRLGGESSRPVASRTPPAARAPAFAGVPGSAAQSAPAAGCSRAAASEQEEQWEEF
ncbi:Methyl-accepting chemotaxis protein III [compost metagenome]